MTPLVICAFFAVVVLGYAIVIFSGLGFAVMIVALCLLPETKGRSLESLEAAE